MAIVPQSYEMQAAKNGMLLALGQLVQQLVRILLEFCPCISVETSDALIVRNVKNWRKADS